MKEWLPCVDGLTVRTGRVLDSVIYRDCEPTGRVCATIHQLPEQMRAASLQSMQEAMQACGYSAKGLGLELEPVPKVKGRRKPKAKARSEAKAGLRLNPKPKAMAQCKATPTAKYNPEGSDRNRPFAHERKEKQLLNLLS